MPPKRGIVALALLTGFLVVCILASSELAPELHRAGALIASGDRTSLVGALFIFALVPIASALTWCRALGPVPLVEGCCRYGVGSLVNTFVPARAGDAVRIVLISRLLRGTRRRLIATRFGSLELVRIGCFGTMALASVERPAAVGAGLAIVALCARAGKLQLLSVVAASALLRVGAFTVALGAFGVHAPLAGALRVVPALEIAAVAPLTPGNVAFASLATSIALGGPVGAGLALGLALHLLETAAAVAFGLASATTLAFRRMVRVHGPAPVWLASPV